MLPDFQRLSRTSTKIPSTVGGPTELALCVIIMIVIDFLIIIEFQSAVLYYRLFSGISVISLSRQRFVIANGRNDASPNLYVEA